MYSSLFSDRFPPEHMTRVKRATYFLSLLRLKLERK